jgi:hypothetical protein
MNRKGQEAGQAISTVIVFFVLLISLVAFYWIGGLASFFSRTAAASDSGFYSGSNGDPTLLSLPTTNDSFLNRPIVVRFEDGDIQLMPLYTFVALYRSDQEALERLNVAIESEPTQAGKDNLIRERSMAYLHSVNVNLFNDVLSYILKQQATPGCLILGQDSGRDLAGRLDSDHSAYDSFLMFDGSGIKNIIKDNVRNYYLPSLSTYHYSLHDKDVIVEYYYGSCLGGKT